MDVILLQITAAIYLLATGSFIFHLVVAKDISSRLSLLLVFAGFLIHTAALGVYFFHTGYPAVTQLREALSFYSWLMVGVYLPVQYKYRLTVLGCFIAPLAFLMSLAAFTFGVGGGELPPTLKTYWVYLHFTLALLAIAFFAVAFAVSFMYLLHEYQLKNKKISVLNKHFPSLERLDRLNYVFLIWGFLIMTLGIISGSLLARVHWGEYWSWEPRQISSAITWILYGGLLHGRLTAGWRGKKAAFWTIVGFAIVLSYFLLGDSVFPGRHGGRFE